MSHVLDHLTIRPLKEDDATSYRELRLRGLKESPEAFSSSYEEELAMPLEFTKQRLQEQTDSPDGFTLGGFDGELVGVVTVLRDRGIKRRHVGFVVGVYVAPEHRGKGVGSALLTEALRRAKSLPDLEQLHLGVAANNYPAVSLYRRLGFEPYGREPRALRIGDQYIDEDLMVLYLHAADI